MTTALAFLLAARNCEIAELDRLAHGSEWIGGIGRFIHALQRERGMSNIFLASRGERFAAARCEQVRACDALQGEVLRRFDALAGDPVALRNGARLFNRIAVSVDAIAALPPLRARIAAQSIAAREATAAFSRLVAGLLAVVFEAADSAGDPEISRALVAMFHFMQGKEYAGQERALGAAVFAGGRIDATEQQRWRHLIQQQHHCFDVFTEHADAAGASAYAASADHRTTVRLERLRRIGQAPGAMPEGESLVDDWYECCTARLDAMRVVEDALAAALKALCGSKIAAAREALRDERASLERMHHDADAAAPDAPPMLGPQLERSVLDMVHAQARRLQEMGDALETARTALAERKLIERAKGVLMARRRVSEDEAYRNLRQLAMNQKRRIADVAQALLAMAEVFPDR